MEYKNIILDDSILAQHEAETKEVHTLLGSIFVEENIPFFWGPYTQRA